MMIPNYIGMEPGMESSVEAVAETGMETKTESVTTLNNAVMAPEDVTFFVGILNELSNINEVMFTKVEPLGASKTPPRPMLTRSASRGNDLHRSV